MATQSSKRPPTSRVHPNNSIAHTIPLPGHESFKGLGPKTKPAHWTNGEGDVSLNGWNFHLKWLIDFEMLPGVPAYKRFCELVVTHAAQKGGFEKINIRSVIHNTTNVGRSRKHAVPGDRDWHITADFAPPKGSKLVPLTAHLYIGPLDPAVGGWAGNKESLNPSKMGIWRPRYNPALPTIEWFDIDVNSDFAKKGRW